MRRWIPVLLAVSACVVTAARAEAAGFATDQQGALYQVVPDEPSIERIGVVEVTLKNPDGTTRTFRPTLTDLALSDLHGLYGISYDSLYRVNPRDPSKSTLVGQLRKRGFGQFNALAFDDQGRLFALEYGRLYQVDLQTGLARELGSLGGNWSSDGDLAWFGGALHATVNGGAGSACHLVRIDMKTWKATDLGAIRTPSRRAARKDDAGTKDDAGKKDARSAKGGRKDGRAEGTGGRAAPPPIRIFRDVWGLIWDGRDLYGVTPGGELIQIDPSNGHAIVVTKVKATFYGACAMLRI